MIWTACEATAYRMHTPKWAVSPLSGAGASLHGGRANRPGVPALYLALETQTAIAEYKQLSPLMPPGTLVSYIAKIGRVVDFSAGYSSPAWSPLWEDFGCDWRKLWFDERIEPPSWVVADEAIAAGAKGLMFRSTVDPAGVNLVVYPAQLTAADTLTVYDPRGDLPRTQDSWKTAST